MSLLYKGDFTASEKSLLNRIIYYPGSKPTVLNVSGEKYILPADCNFLMSDAQNLGPLVNYGQFNHDMLTLVNSVYNSLW